MELTKRENLRKLNSPRHLQQNQAIASAPKLQDQSLVQKGNPDKVKDTDSTIANDSSINDKNLANSLLVLDKINEYLRETSNKENELSHVKSNQIENKENISTTINERTSECETTIEALPIEIICKIINYLNFNDKKSASLCCKKWRNAFLESYYLKNILIKANNNLFISSLSSSNNLSSNQSLSQFYKTKHHAPSNVALTSYSTDVIFNNHLYRSVVNLEFENDSADPSLLLSNLRKNSDTLGFTNQMGLLSKLENLKFLKCTLGSKILIDLFNESPKLKSVHLVQCDSLFMSGFLSHSPNSIPFNLKNVVELNLSKNRYLTDFLINLFLNSTPLLEKLDISYCNLTQTSYKSISNSINGNGNLNGSAVYLSIENLIKMLKGKNLSSVNLSGIELFNHEESLMNITSSTENLKELILSNLPNLKAESISKVINKLPFLESIDLNGSIQSDDLGKVSVETILDRSTLNLRLKALKLSKAKINNPNLFSDQLSIFKNLNYLDLSSIMLQRSFANVSKVNEFIENFANNLAQSTQIEYLILSYCDFLVNDVFIKIIARHLTKIKHLDIKNCYQITNSSLHHISNYLSELVYLDVSWCRNISDYGFNSSIEIDKNQQSLDKLNASLSGPAHSMRKYIEQPFLLLKTKNELKNDSSSSTIENDLDMQLENESSITSFKKLKKLRVLKLESCINVTDVGILRGINLEQLNELNVKLCTNLTGSFIESIKLNVNDRSRFDHNEFKLLTNMKALNLNQCVNFEEKYLMILIKNSPNMREFNISAIQSVSKQTIDLLISNRKLLTNFDVSFCPNLYEHDVERYEQFLSQEFGSREFHLDKRFIRKHD